MKIKRRQMSPEELSKALETGYPVSLGSSEVASLLGISKTSLYKAIRENKFPQALAISAWNYKVWGTAEVAQWMRDKGIPFPTLERTE